MVEGITPVDYKEDDGYCEYCDEPNPEYELSTHNIGVFNLFDVIFLFCDRECAECYLDAR